jgi:pilus assembly protein CpaE
MISPQQRLPNKFRDALSSAFMENALIRILPACLVDSLPEGWDAGAAGFVIEVTEPVRQPSEILPSINVTEPDVLLLDADYAEMDAFGMTQQALETRPGLAVVIISRDAAPDRLRRAMLAGAEEYLIKPLGAREMGEAIMAVTSHRTLRRVQRAASADAAPSSEQEGIVVGVVAGKGGLGKTTIASNLAMLVSKTPGRSAALIGLESGDGAVLLSLQPKLGLLDLAGTNAVDGQNSNYTAEWIKQFSTAHKSGLQYWTWQGSSTQPGAVIPEDFFEQFFAAMRNAFSVTVIDFPLLSADEATHVLPLLDVVIVVSSSSDLLALRSARTFLDMIPAEMNEKVHLIINRADETDMISREDFEHNLNRKVSGVINNESRLAAEAINMGAPIVLMQPQSEIATDLLEVAQALFGLPSRDEGEPRRKRFRLFG